MNKLKHPLALLLIVATAFSFTSCGGDDEDQNPVDPRDQAMGTYNYTTTVYYLDGTDLVKLDNGDPGTAIIEKTDNGFQLKEGGEVQFKAVKVAKASNGFTFDIESQTIKDDDGENITIDGYQGVQLGSGASATKYDGLYDSSTKQMTAFFKFQEDDGNGGTIAIVIRILGTRQ